MPRRRAPTDPSVTASTFACSTSRRADSANVSGRISGSGFRCRHQQEIYSPIEITSTTITHSTMVMSIQPPNGGASGSAFRSGITANSIAAYHVVIGGWNFLLSRDVWTATKRPKEASAISTPRRTTPNPTVLSDRVKSTR